MKTVGDLIAENTKLKEDNRELRLLFRRLYGTIVSVLEGEKNLRMREIIKLVEEE
tara:strand:- start:523 stop:687 length:165 start_codon:yes stop_codon:yes gene_type:complete